jgi:anti-sigma B factor antagonist
MSEQRTGSTPVIVALPAEIDLSNAEQVYDQLSAALTSGAATVIADFTGTRFCDCACLNRVLRVHNQAAGHNAQLRLVIPPGAPLREVVELLGLDQQLPVYPSTDAAQADPGQG